MQGIKLQLVCTQVEQHLRMGSTATAPTAGGRWHAVLRHGRRPQPLMCTGARTLLHCPGEQHSTQPCPTLPAWRRHGSQSTEATAVAMCRADSPLLVWMVVLAPACSSICTAMEACSASCLGCIRSGSGCSSSSRCAMEGQALATCGGRTEAWPSSQRACLDGGLVCALQGQVQGDQALIRPPRAVQGGAVDGCVQQSTHAFRPAPLLCVLQQHLPGWRERWHSGRHAACFEHQYKPPAGTAGGHQQAAAV